MAHFVTARREKHMRSIALVAALTAAVFVGVGSQSASAATTTNVTKPAPVMVTVAEGDSLSKIAEAKQTTYVRVFNANDKIANPDVINPGQELRIPAADEELPDRYADWQAQQQAAAPAPVAAAKPAAAPVASASATSYPALSSNAAKAFIYAKESGNNPAATNPSGCFGIGQDCNGVLRSMCGVDYNCQDAYFTNYAMNRYGGWEGAYSFWVNHGWW